ncbi:HD domain-containing protein [Fructilactobacillus myrtifloralis]|uniref:HD domain-containing protein n=1 Tax=Fructilactobacillus myrtifloralis TaxID=2940301 RepID=A0ABY5BMF9_9LACO|nr:HD domain-containing protein [Fructilactobacillus myrtifloralis]USS84870.1 HD domain-containing protein [Fructilactobacillus myrtifloralis]
MNSQTEKLKQEKVIRDPVHSHIYIQDQIIMDLINTAEFQRLRRIHQLGTTSLTFPGAEHTRFAHSLGVYEIVRRICNHFQRNYPTQAPNDGLWDDHERLVAECAGLLHDIGHGTYSHTFEHIFKTNHEAITQAIITSEQTEVNQVLRKLGPNFPNQVASVINKTYPNQQVVQMISSQCDADRMDYLLRDSYFTGAQYGNFDLDRILQVMRPYHNGICFKKSGLHAIEYYIVSRYQMYLQVYFHPTSRSMEVILAHLLKRAQLIAQDPAAPADFQPGLLRPFLTGTFDIQRDLTQYLRLDDGVLTTYFATWQDFPDRILADLATRFLDRKPFKSAKFTQQTEPLLPRLQRLVADVGFDPAYYTATDNSYNQPYDVYDPSDPHPNAQIELMERDGSLIELSQASLLVQTITGRDMGDSRFFFPKELFQPEAAGLFADTATQFQSYIHNDQIINPKESTND